MNHPFTPPAVLAGLHSLHGCVEAAALASVVQRRHSLLMVPYATGPGGHGQGPEAVSRLHAHDERGRQDVQGSQSGRRIVRGLVVTLAQKGDQEAGRVDVYGVVGDRPRTVICELSPRDYSLATRAHDSKTEVVVVGTLEQDTSL